MYYLHEMTNDYVYDSLPYKTIAQARDAGYDARKKNGEWKWFRVISKHLGKNGLEYKCHYETMTPEIEKLVKSKQQQE